MKISIIGSGAFGCAIAQVFADNETSKTVSVYGIVKSEIDEINKGFKTIKGSSQTKKFTLNEKIKASSSFKEVLTDTEIVVLAVPIFAVKKIVTDLNNFFVGKKKKIYLVNVAKGIEKEEGLFVSEIVKNNFDQNKLEAFVGIFGPTFAKELLVRKQSALTIFAEEKKTFEKVSSLLKTEYLHLNFETEVNCAEILSACKNIIAIAMGMLSGKEFSINTKIAVFTKAYQDVKSIITLILKQKLLVLPEKNSQSTLKLQFLLKLTKTLNQLLSFAGIGDLVLTSFSENSRNYHFGNKISELNDTEKAISFFNEKKITVEGLNTIYAFEKFVERKKIQKPHFFKLMSEIIFKNKSWKELLKLLWE